MLNHKVLKSNFAGVGALVCGFLSVASVALVSCGKDEPKKSVSSSSAPAKVDAPSAKEIYTFMTDQESNVQIPASLSGLRAGLKSPESIKANGFELEATEMGALVIVHDKNGKHIHGINLNGMGLKNGDQVNNEAVDLIEKARNRYTKLDRSHWELVKIAYLRGRLSTLKGGHGLSRVDAAKSAMEAEEYFFEDFKSNYPEKNLGKMTQKEIIETFEDYLDWCTPAQSDPTNPANEYRFERARP